MHVFLLCVTMCMREFIGREGNSTDLSLFLLSTNPVFHTCYARHSHYPAEIPHKEEQNRVLISCRFTMLVTILGDIGKAQKQSLSAHSY